jgi:hypothetical protein
MPLTKVGSDMLEKLNHENFGRDTLKSTSVLSSHGAGSGRNK